GVLARREERGEETVGDPHLALVARAYGGTDESLGEGLGRAVVAGSSLGGYEHEPWPDHLDTGDHLLGSLGDGLEDHRVAHLVRREEHELWARSLRRTA